MTGPGPELTLLVPCFNEGERVDRCVEALLAWRDAHPGLRAEVLLVDDGSGDDTAERATRWARRDPTVRLLALLENRGKGAALRAGMEAAEGEIVVFLDADLAVGVEHVDRVLPALRDGVDVAVGCRNVPGAEVSRPQGLARRLLGRGYLALARWTLGLRVSDVTCGFKGFRRDAGRRLFRLARSDRWGIDAEVLYLAEREGLVLAEVPVTWRDGDVSAVRLRRDVLGSLRELTAVRRRHRDGAG
jgi:dolichyl-phosphate beta-glucosyltransferase